MVKTSKTRLLVDRLLADLSNQEKRFITEVLESNSSIRHTIDRSITKSSSDSDFNELWLELNNDPTSKREIEIVTQYIKSDSIPRSPELQMYAMTNKGDIDRDVADLLVRSILLGNTHIYEDGRDRTEHRMWLMDANNRIKWSFDRSFSEMRRVFRISKENHKKHCVITNTEDCMLLLIGPHFDYDLEYLLKDF